MPDSDSDRPSSKVARLIDTYDLDGLGAELEARWTAEGDERLSLRDLATLFNRRLLERALLDAGLDAMPADVERTYRNLTADDVSAGVRTDTRNRLERNGVDVETLEDEFVTYQAVRSYLKEWRGAEYDQLSDGEKRRKDLQTIQRLLTRAESVTTDRLESNREMDRLALGQFEVFVGARVFCQECGTQHTVADLFEQGGCGCFDD